MHGGHQRPKSVDEFGGEVTEKNLLIRAMQMPGTPMPLPDWYGVYAIAEKWGVKPEDVLHQPSYWVSRAQILLSAESFVQAENARKSS